MTASPWTRGQLALLGVLNGGGGALVLAAWSATSRTAALDRHVRWLDVAVLGVVLAAGADVLWLLNGRRATVARQRTLLADVLAARAPIAAAAPVTSDALVRVTGSHLAHRPDCLLVRGKATGPIPRGPRRTARSRLEPCRVCLATGER